MATYFNWKNKFGGLLLSKVQRHRQLEEENVRLKRIVADMSLDKELLQDVIRRKLKTMRPGRRRLLIDHLRGTWRVSSRNFNGETVTEPRFLIVFEQDKAPAAYCGRTPEPVTHA